MKDEAVLWIRYADENLHSAQLLLENGLYNPCLQNAQQAIEKMLKAFLIEKSVKIRKTHSVRELLNILKEQNFTIDISEDESDLIDSIYLPSKYPVGCILPDYEPDATICRQCLEIASHIREFVRKHLK